MRTSDLNVTKLEQLQSLTLLMAAHEGLITLTEAEIAFILKAIQRT